MSTFRKKLLFISLIGILALGIFWAAKAATSEKTETQKKVWVCPPCDSECDKRTFDKAGACPVCGMSLVEQGSANAQSHRPHHDVQSKKVAILVFEGVQIIDYAAPWEVFGQAGFDVFSVAEKADPITTAMGMTVVPNYTFQNHPAPDILMLPGGDVPAHLNDTEVIQWIQKNAKESEYVLSVCNGAFFLAKAGLLDGLEATTFAALIDGLQEIAPNTKVVRDKRFVDNGKIITTAGLTSGVDGALHVVEKINGKGETQRIATNMEYNWDPDSKYVRAALADQYVIRAMSGEFPFEAKWKWEQSQGTTDHWDAKWTIIADTTPESLLEAINGNLLNRGNWSKVSTGKTDSSWKFVDEKGRTWNGKLVLNPVPDQKNEFLVSLNIKLA